MMDLGGSSSFCWSVLPSNCCIWDANVSSSTCSITSLLYDHSSKGKQPTPGRHSKNGLWALKRNYKKINLPILQLSRLCTRPCSLCGFPENSRHPKPRLVSNSYDKRRNNGSIDRSFTCPIRSQKPRHMATNTWTSETLCTWFIAPISWSFNSCILPRISDSRTNPFESWMIFLSFVVFCMRVCT